MDSKEDKRLEAVEREILSIHKLMGDMSTEVKLMAQSMRSIQTTIEKMADQSSTLHDHDKRIESNTLHINNLLRYAAKADEEISEIKDKEIPEIKKQVINNETVATLAKFLLSGIFLSGIGLVVNAVFGAR